MRRWIDAWRSAWPAEDVERIASEYAETARSYVERAFGEEKLVSCWFGEPVVDRERAAVEYWAVLRSPRGDEVTIAGCAFLRFGEDGRVVEHRDYWDQTNGAREPSSRWGR